jgi:hypothetical protein
MAACCLVAAGHHQRNITTSFYQYSSVVRVDIGVDDLRYVLLSCESTLREVVARRHPNSLLVGNTSGD